MRRRRADAAEDEEAERCLVEALTGLDRAGHADDKHARQARANLVKLYERLGRGADADRWRSRKR